MSTRKSGRWTGGGGGGGRGSCGRGEGGGGGHLKRVAEAKT